MYFKLTLLSLLALGCNWTAIFILTINLVIVTFGKRIFAAFLDFFSKEYNVVSDSMKVELFKELNDTKPEEKVWETQKENLEMFILFLIDFHPWNWWWLRVQLQVLGEGGFCSGGFKCYLIYPIPPPELGCRAQPPLCPLLRAKPCQVPKTGHTGFEAG